MARLRSNLAFASISQILRYAAPLLIYPYLTRTLGIDAMGYFSTVMAAGLMCSVFVEFGYGLMSVRELAGDDRRVTGTIVSELCLGRAVMFLLVAVGLAITCHYVDLLADMGAYLAALAIALAYGFSASWYYIAAERSKALAALDLCCSVATFLLILVFVQGPNDAPLALWLFVMPLLLTAIYGHGLACVRYGFQWTSIRALLRSLALSLRFFFFTGFPSLANRWSVIALAVWSDPVQVVYFAAGEKLTTAAINTTVPLTRVLLPRLGRLMADRPGLAYRQIRRYAVWIGGFYLCASIATIALSGFIYPLMFGVQLAAGSIVFAAQMLMVPFAASSRVLVQVGFTTFRKEGFSALVIIASTLAYLCLSVLIVQASGGIGIALVRAAIELVVLAIFVRSFIKLGRNLAQP